MTILPSFPWNVFNASVSCFSCDVDQVPIQRWTSIIYNVHCVLRSALQCLTSNPVSPKWYDLACVWLVLLLPNAFSLSYSGIPGFNIGDQMYLESSHHHYEERHTVWQGEWPRSELAAAKETS